MAQEKEMQSNYVYSKITELDEEEKIGYAYYLETGDYLNYIDLTYLLKQADPCDFRTLKKEEAQAHRRHYTQKLNTDFSGVLSEQFFLPADANSEIQHLPRYIDIPAHRHDFFEIVCTLSGNCLHEVEGTAITMKQGDITIIPPHVKHYLKAEPHCATLTIKIRRSAFDSAFSVLLRSGTTLSAYFTQTLYAKHYRNSLTFHCGQDLFLQELLLYMLTQQLEKKPYCNHVLDGLLAAFFPYLLQNYEDTIELAEGDDAMGQRMTAIESYMRQNYRTATLTDTAGHFFISPAYLSVLVKKQTGYTFSAILRQIKMERAAQLLSETTMKVGMICESVGYQDTTQFIRTFKKYYGTTPYRYRKGLREKG